MSAYDYLFKYLLIGDSGVGKTSIMLRFVDDQFNSRFMSTIGIDFKIKIINIDNKKIKLQIWDTAGQEKFRTITNAYFRGAMGIIIVYDVTDRNSFNNIKTWLKSVEQHCDYNIKIILLANKCDLENHRVVSTEEGKLIAMNNNILYFETSAKDNIEIENPIISLTKSIIIQKLERIKSFEPKNHVLLKQPTIKSKFNCCIL